MIGSVSNCETRIVEISQAEQKKIKINKIKMRTI